ncbi:hypothetical protein Ciccas_001952 [Cichlidogyrus casuarinus]|uniref:Protein kinase domain-containing protein n=1 Tax=Cichlidogyrus casuarinus TaxID=1844966 RepID=A0ABD2QJ58_9PLAT
MNTPPNIKVVMAQGKSLESCLLTNRFLPELKKCDYTSENFSKNGRLYEALLLPNEKMAAHYVASQQGTVMLGRTEHFRQFKFLRRLNFTPPVMLYVKFKKFIDDCDKQLLICQILDRIRDEKRFGKKFSDFDCHDDLECLYKGNRIELDFYPGSPRCKNKDKATDYTLATILPCTLLIVFAFCFFSLWKLKHFLEVKNNWTMKEEEFFLDSKKLATEAFNQENPEKLNKRIRDFPATVISSSRYVPLAMFHKQTQDHLLLIPTSLNREHSIPIKVKEELLRMKKLRNPGIQSFYGLFSHHSLDISKAFYLVVERPVRGDLHGLLNRDGNCKNDITIQLGFIKIMSSALLYLHENQIIHGNLSSRCVIIDDRFNLKLAMWQGMDQLEVNGKFLRTDTKINQAALSVEDVLDAKLIKPAKAGFLTDNLRHIWQAPELLIDYYRGLDHPDPLTVTVAGDVFSFGTICYEIFMNSLPFMKEAEEGNLSSSELCGYLLNTDDRFPAWDKVKSIGNSVIESRVHSLVERCVKSEPAQRIELEDFVAEFKQLLDEHPKSRDVCPFDYFLATQTQ